MSLRDLYYHVRVINQTPRESIKSLFSNQQGVFPNLKNMFAARRGMDGESETAIVIVV